MIDYIVKNLESKELATVLIILGLVREVRLMIKLLLSYKLAKRK